MRSVFNDLLFRFVTVLTMLHQDKNLYSTRAWVGFSLKRGPPQPRLSFWDFLPLSHLARYRCKPSRGVGGSGRANPTFPLLCFLLFTFPASLFQPGTHLFPGRWVLGSPETSVPVAAEKSPSPQPGDCGSRWTPGCPTASRWLDFKR